MWIIYIYTYIYIWFIHIYIYIHGYIRVIKGFLRGYIGFRA